jgi:hypothetical protein
MLARTLGASVPAPNKGKKVRINICPQNVLQVQPKHVLISVLAIFVCGDT